ncbi:uncharacterized protein EI90DRAFT_3115689 [Cantharellus anzutake]|uniref:uncharacterized protein n=1 Tax=Cantharellus anzutake TaxID=1750568 RepID=UPI001908A78E|nr:uncharacterized protein EI90DRAFT_3115689 [Cantharellus anzutake]KAF8343172.1 hypothetical protein EI90DRAFT_3115689 [Cantharellus anzutake]
MKLQTLLGHSADSNNISSCLSELGTPDSVPNYDLKTYSDVVYYNYHSLGLSLVFSPIEGYKPKTRASASELSLSKLILTGIDIYNRLETASDRKDSAPYAPKIVNAQYSPYPAYPISLLLPSAPPDRNQQPSSSPPNVLAITPDTTGKIFVEALGEPSRKGGGTGPSSGSINIWCEWSRLGLMIEFGGNDARGPQAWERGKDARWSVISIFRPPKTQE